MSQIEYVRHGSCDTCLLYSVCMYSGRLCKLISSMYQGYVLQIGAVNAQLLSGPWLSVRAIDLRPCLPSIEQADFLQLQPAGDFDIVVCAMVHNCVCCRPDKISTHKPTEGRSSPSQQSRILLLCSSDIVDLSSNTNMWPANWALTSTAIYLSTADLPNVHMECRPYSAFHVEHSSTLHMHLQQLFPALLPDLLEALH